MEKDKNSTKEKISLDDFKKLKLLGKGATGHVYLVQKIFLQEIIMQ